MNRATSRDKGDCGSSVRHQETPAQSRGPHAASRALGSQRWPYPSGCPSVASGGLPLRTIAPVHNTPRLRCHAARLGGGGGVGHKASVLSCLPLAAPISLSPLLILTLCGPERVLVVSTRGGGGGSIGQVWTRHLAPAAPASQPSLPTQFHDCACHADSALQFLSLPSALNGVRVGLHLQGSGLCRLFGLSSGRSVKCVPLWCPPAHWYACVCWPLLATYLCFGFTRSWGVGAVRGVRRLGGGGGGWPQGLGIELFAFGDAYWPLTTAHSDPLWVRTCFGCVHSGGGGGGQKTAIYLRQGSVAGSQGYGGQCRWLWPDPPPPAVLRWRSHPKSCSGQRERDSVSPALRHSTERK